MGPFNEHTQTKPPVPSTHEDETDKLVEELNTGVDRFRRSELAEKFGNSVVRLTADNIDKLNEKGLNQALLIAREVATVEDLPDCFKILSSEKVTGSWDLSTEKIVFGIINSFPDTVVASKFEESGGADTAKKIITNIFARDIIITESAVEQYIAAVDDLSTVLRFKIGDSLSAYSTYHSSLAAWAEEPTTDFGNVNPKFIAKYIRSYTGSYDYLGQIRAIEFGTDETFFLNDSLTRVDAGRNFEGQAVSVSRKSLENCFKDFIFEGEEETKAVARVLQTLGIDIRDSAALSKIVAGNLHFRPKEIAGFVPANRTYALLQGALDLKDFLEQQKELNEKKRVQILYGTTNPRFAAFCLRLGCEGIAVATGRGNVVISNQQLELYAALCVKNYNHQYALKFREMGEKLPEEVTEEEVLKLGIKGIDSLKQLQMEFSVLVVGKVARVEEEVTKLANPARLERLRERFTKQED